MATSTGPDLSFAETAVEQLMDDVCVILRDVGGDGDGTLDYDTGKLTDAAPVPVYAGRCSFSTSTLAEAAGEAEVGGALVPKQSQAVSIPLSYVRAHPEAEPQEGDVVLAVSARRDPGLVGSQFDVTRVLHKTMAVSRRILVKPRPVGSVVELPGVVVLSNGDPVPNGTPPGTLIVRI